MQEMNDKISVELTGLFAHQVRQMSQMMGVTHEAIIQMAIAGFSASPIATSGAMLSEAKSQPVHAEETPTSLDIIGSQWAALQKQRADEPYNPWEHLRADYIDFDSIKVAPSTSPDPDYFLWGQFSRFLTIKYTLRVLAWLGQDCDGKVPLQEWKAAVRSGSPEYRDMLRKLDVERRTRRGAQMASGFPKDTEKSTERFTTHFCADIYSNGKLVGMPAHLGLITHSDEIIQFTPEGLAYVKAVNPIMDYVGPDGRTIGADEEKILLCQLRDHLPSEWAFMLQVRDWIGEGHNTPALLTAQVTAKYGEGTETDWNEKQVPTYRGGVIGRLGELALISREWNFRSVTYHKDGEGFLKLPQ
jgi:hypothetical protein